MQHAVHLAGLHSSSKTVLLRTFCNSASKKYGGFVINKYEKACSATIDIKARAFYLRCSVLVKRLFEDDINNMPGGSLRIVNMDIRMLH
jgi:hypothetical protein